MHRPSTRFGVWAIWWGMALILMSASSGFKIFLTSAWRAIMTGLHWGDWISAISTPTLAAPTRGRNRNSGRPRAST